MCIENVIAEVLCSKMSENVGNEQAILDIAHELILIQNPYDIEYILWIYYYLLKLNPKYSNFIEIFLEKEGFLLEDISSIGKMMTTIENL
jgi:hypothetical protein